MGTLFHIYTRRGKQKAPYTYVFLEIGERLNSKERDLFWFSGFRLANEHICLNGDVSAH